MLTYFIDSASKEPMYEQLYRQIRNAIDHGILASDSKLPSKRMLADHLKISTITVQTAYDQLLAEGYVRSVERSGYYVEAIELSAMPASSSLKPESPLFATTYRYDLRTNTVDPAMFPSKLWSRLTRGVLSDQSGDLWNTVDVQGMLSLRSAIATHLERFRGMIVDSRQIVVGTGSEYLLDLLVKLLGRDKAYAIEDPGYAKVVKVLESAGASVTALPLDESGISPLHLETSQVDVVHVTPSHQFPTGIVMPVKRRRELLKWASAKANRFIIEDDYDSEFRFTGAPIPALQRLDDFGKVIYLNSFTKSLAPSMRIAYMVLPIPLLTMFRERFSYLTCPVPNLEQKTLALFLENGHFERHLNRMKIVYRNRRNQFLQWIRQSRGLSRATIRGENAGLHFLLMPNTGASEKELVDRALAQNIRVYGLSEFSLSRSDIDTPTIVIGYSGIDESCLEDLFQRFNTAWSAGATQNPVIQ